MYAHTFEWVLGNSYSYTSTSSHPSFPNLSCTLVLLSGFLVTVTRTNQATAILVFLDRVICDVDTSRSTGARRFVVAISAICNAEESAPVGMRFHVLGGYVIAFQRHVYGCTRNDAIVIRCTDNNIFGVPRWTVVRCYLSLSKLRAHRLHAFIVSSMHRALAK